MPSGAASPETGRGVLVALSGRIQAGDDATLRAGIAGLTEAGSAATARRSTDRSPTPGTDWLDRSVATGPASPGTVLVPAEPALTGTVVALRRLKLSGGRTLGRSRLTVGRGRPRHASSKRRPTGRVHNRLTVNICL